MSDELTKKMLNSPQFRAAQEQLKRASREYKQSLSEKYESNAEVQRNRTRSKDDIAAEAVDRMTGSIKAFNDAKEGKSTSEEAAREKARYLARRSGIDDA